MALSSTSAQLADEKEASLLWFVVGGRWIAERESGIGIDFEDEGLKRIDRSTVAELASLADMIPAIQKKVDQMDAGLNPLGISAAAIPFDITPIGEGDDAKTHFEQIRERAGTALANARKLLDKAQFYGSRMRMLQESQFSREDQLETMELETKNKLIGYFGYPYEGDIGPGGTYPQGYDGPDVYNYAWMEPAAYGLSDTEDVKSVTTNIYVRDISKFGEGSSVNVENFGATANYITLTYEKSATGFILKPANITGKRRACGQIQDKLGEFLVAYCSFKGSLKDWELANTAFERVHAVVKRNSNLAAIKYADQYARFAFDTYASYKKAALESTIIALELAQDLGEEAQKKVIGATPKIIGAGMTVNTDPSAIVNASLGPAQMTYATATKGSIAAAKMDQAATSAVEVGFNLVEKIFESVCESYERKDQYYSSVADAAGNVLDAAKACRNAYVELLSAEAAVEAVIAEAERAIDERTLARQQASDVLTKTRYNEMFFRIARNNALSRYSAQFDLAQKYAYLAAQAYDYETGLLSTDRASGEKFIARIVGTRTLGEFDDDGNPIVASDAAKGDGGLAAILAELDANWLVLKPRLGINNPQSYATWFSLRHDLFRIYDEEDGDKAWKTELRKYMVEDLNALPEFTHYCQPLAGSAAQKEPGLVIPFSSYILHGFNFFGEPLVGGDSASRSSAATPRSTPRTTPRTSPRRASTSRATTTIRSRRRRPPTSCPSARTACGPSATPTRSSRGGSWTRRSPRRTPSAPRSWTTPTGRRSTTARRAAFRAYYDDEGKDPSDDSLDCTRLVGRSAWNTKWLLIIPAGSLGADREAALATFINGIDSNRDGTLDFKGVTDIKIGLKTYSTSGN